MRKACPTKRTTTPFGLPTQLREVWPPSDRRTKFESLEYELDILVAN